MTDRFEDPKRLAEGGSSELSALTRAAQRDLPSRAEVARVGAALAPLMGGAALGVGAAISSGGQASAAGAAAGVSGGKVVAGVVAACAIAAGSIYGVVKTSKPMALESAEPVVTQVAPPRPAEPPTVVAPLPSEAPSAEKSQPEEKTPLTAAPNTAPPAQSELSLLSSARRALKSQPERALALTQKHRLLYPSGALSQEREVIAIEALKLLGRGDSAKQRAESFKSKYPGSAHAPKVDEVIEAP